MLKKKSTFSKIIKSYRDTTGNLKFYSTISFGVFLSVLVSLEPLIFTEIIKKIESFLLTGEILFQEILLLTLLWGIFIIISIVLSYIFDYFFLAKTIIHNYHEISLQYAKKISQMSYGRYLEKKIGSIYKILDRGTENQVFFLYSLLLGVLKNVVSIIFISILLFILNWKMAIVTLGLIPVACGIGIFIYKKVAHKQKLQDEVYIGAFGILGEGLSNFGLTKILGLEGKFYADMKHIFDSSFTRQLQINKGWALGHGYTAAIVMTSRIMVILFGFYLISIGDITFATLFLFFSYIGWIYFPLGFLFEQMRQFQKYITAIEIMHDEFDDLDSEDIFIGKDIKNIEGNLEFRNVSFAYQEEKKILRNLSLCIKKGQKIAIVGETGAGKSTLIHLLLRFWEVSTGEILLDGKNINIYKKSSLRNHIGVVSQDNSLFNLSIEENLRFANPKATKKDIEDALKKAEAHFVFELPHGLKTIIGERGLKLSGGEKQRVSIARLFLKNPEILILDEATSALDNTTERLIQKSLERLMKGKTSIIIAHRLSTIQNADMIYVMEKGKIVESGTYSKLVEKGGKFATLANPDKLILG